MINVRKWSVIWAQIYHTGLSTKDETVRTTQHSKNITILSLNFSFLHSIEDIFYLISQCWPKRNPECKKTDFTNSVFEVKLFVGKSVCLNKYYEHFVFVFAPPDLYQVLHIRKAPRLYFKIQKCFAKLSYF